MSLLIGCFPVADLSIMLALMAGRNVKETYEIVQSGSVRVFFTFAHRALMSLLNSGLATSGRRSASVGRSCPQALQVHSELQDSSDSVALRTQHFHAWFRSASSESCTHRTLAPLPMRRRTPHTQSALAYARCDASPSQSLRGKATWYSCSPLAGLPRTTS